MKSITINLPDEALKHIDQQVACGDYRSAGEYLASLVARDCGDDTMPIWMKEAVSKGIASLDRGEGIRVTPEMWEEKKQKFVSAMRQKRGEVA